MTDLENKTVIGAAEEYERQNPPETRTELERMRDVSKGFFDFYVHAGDALIEHSVSELFAPLHQLFTDALEAECAIRELESEPGDPKRETARRIRECQLQACTDGIGELIYKRMKFYFQGVEE
jgi:hypothetical protein